MKRTKESPYAQTLYASPFSKGFWTSARMEFLSTRKLTLAALLAAVAVIIDQFFLPIGGPFLRIYFSYLVAALLSAVCGPLYGIGAGLLVDNLSFLIAGGDPAGYFPGYAVSSILSYLIYGLMLYRTKITVLRLSLSRLTVNIFINVILGSVWKHILYGKAYLVYFISGAIKNIAMLPIEVLLLTLLFSKIIPILRRNSLIPSDTTVTVRKKDIIISVVLAFVGAAVLYAYYCFKN